MKKLALTCYISLLCGVCTDVHAQDSIVGVASYYSNRLHGRKTASGEPYDKEEYTCAHLKFKFGTKLLIRHLDTGKEVVVKVNDRGPYSRKYTIDLSYAAARDLGIVRAGHARVAIILYNESLKHKSHAVLPSFSEYVDTTNVFTSFTPPPPVVIHPEPLPIHHAAGKK